MKRRVTVLPVALFVGLGSVAASASAPQRSGKALFVQHCARCHTTSGAGLGESHPAFGNFAAPPADFTDPLFASMEPAADWFLVVKHGGQPMGLSPQMPAHAERLSDEEIERILAYVKTIADTHCYPRGELNFLRPILTKKAFPETELLYLGRWDHGEVDQWKSTLYYAHRLSRRWSAEVKLSHVAGGGTNEVEEAEVGGKFAVYPGSRLLVTLGAEAEIPFEGDAKPIAIPYAAYATALGEKLTLQGALDVALPLDGVDLGQVRLSHAVHWLTTRWRRGLFPGLEVTGWVPFSSDADWGASVTPQLRLSMSKRGHVSLTAGVEIPLRGADYDWRGHTFLLWDIADGPFWEGW